MKLVDLTCDLTEALERIIQMPESSRPFIVVQAVSPRWTNNEGPFVQFVGDDKRPLCLDVPLLEQHLIRGYEITGPGMHDTEYGFAIDNITPQQGAELALHILKNGFGVGLAEEIAITEQTTATLGKA